MTALEELRGYIGEIAEINSAINLTIWDQRTHMPPAGAKARARVMARLERLSFERMISPALGELLDRAEREAVTEIDRAMVRYWKRERERKGSIPPQKYQSFVEACAQGEHAWREARVKKDFSILRPYLEKIVDHVRELAECIGYEESPYDVPLDGLAIRLAGHPGMTIAKLRGVMESLRGGLVELLRRVQEDGINPEPLPGGRFPIESQRALCVEALKAIGYDFEMGALDDTVHPFSCPVAPGDVRVTSRYREDDPFDGLFSALHEGGHALYMQGFGKDLEWTGLDDAASSGFHESQARFWENLIGRSLAFWEFFLPRLADRFPEYKTTTPEQVWRAVNVVSPGYIRVGADELTYNLHIILRIELEVALIEGRLEVRDLPEAWNAYMKETIGLVPPDDALGVLQDVHWSAGKIGVFPAYLLGNLYSAQILSSAERAIPDLWERIRKGDLISLREWLREAVHKRGRIISADELIQEISGEPLSARPFLDYAKGKFTQVYRLR